MNDKKICIISCGKQKNKLNNLIIPKGYEVENKYISNKANIARSYNEILSNSKAKYKIYLKEGVSLNNKNVLKDIINIFSSNNNIGMIGVAGSETIPTSGLWLESINKFGKYIDSNSAENNIVQYREIKEYYKKLNIIDGMFMATQYDIKWREDLFDDIYFYDTAQCVEFAKAGYEIVVPKQDEPWCATNEKLDHISRKFKIYNEVFLEKYSKDIFPLVSILIPAYNRTKLLKIALQSAINQTYKNIEIVICDDSTNNEVENTIKLYLSKYKNIRYYNNGGPLGEKGLKNILKCLELSRGEFINYLYDDDVFDQFKIEKMMNYFIEYSDIIFVTSNRELIDIDGKVLEKQAYNECLFEKDTIIDGNCIGEYIVKHNMINIVGEMTTVLLRKKDLEKSVSKCFDYQCKSLGDLGKWLELLSKGKIVYISEVLSYFRQHEETNTNDVAILCNGIIDYWNIIVQVYERKLYFHSKVQFLSCLINYYKMSLNILKKIKGSNVDIELKKEIYLVMDKAIRKILNLQNITDIG